MPRCSALLAILVQINQLFELLKMVGFNKRDMPKIFRAAGKDVGGVSGNPRKFRHSALWNFLGGWSAA